MRKIMKIQVLAEHEKKIQTEVKEIWKVFYCELCNKQYKLVMEFEAHLSSYDHNNRKEMHESGSTPVSISSESRTVIALIDQEQRNTLKFRFSSKGFASKLMMICSNSSLNRFNPANPVLA
ncbi:unnamed protein product [Vicia faba]|uniref:C2H2-type domain-containing protein n=1 Tax=Vicia faba TaxID=3906 RepID=A0AAV0YRI1_VICFA|nr:unnamed protein product [Vicia faba]